MQDLYFFLQKVTTRAFFGHKRVNRAFFGQKSYDSQLFCTKKHNKKVTNRFFFLINKLKIITFSKQKSNDS